MLSHNQFADCEPEYYEEEKVMESDEFLCDMNLIFDNERMIHLTQDEHEKLNSEMTPLEEHSFNDQICIHENI